MPEWLPTLVDVAPQLGIAAFLAWLLLRVWDRAATDRTTYERGLSDAQQRYRQSLEAAQQRNDHDTDALRSEIEWLHRRIEELNRALDEEREARRRAQEAAWGRIGGDA